MSTEQKNNRVDEALDETFPASDAPCWTPGKNQQGDTHSRPKQHQAHQPGKQTKMIPLPEAEMKNYKAAGKLKNKVALISGGDSGIGRAVAIGYAKEGADIAIIYLDEDGDAKETQKLVEAEGRNVILIKGDIGNKEFCEEAVSKTVQKLGHLNILVNNAGEQHVEENFEDISEEQLRRTFDTNIFGMVFLTQAALKHLQPGDNIINTASVVAYRGHDQLMDYGTTKGAVLGLTRSLANNLTDRDIRVNAVAPGPIWTPLIPASFDAETVQDFGKSSPMGRAGQPDEVAPAYIYLASDDASYMTGQTIHPNGGNMVGG